MPRELRPTACRSPSGHGSRSTRGDGFRPYAELRAGQSSDDLRDRRAGQIMFYTSGTTGRPKGVRKQFAETSADDIELRTGIGMRGPMPLAVDSAWPADAVTVICGPCYHAAPIASAVLALDAGGLLVLMDRWTPEGFLAVVQEHRVTHASMVPTMFHRLLALPEAVRAEADVSSLQVVLHAGGTVPDRREAPHDRVVGADPRRGLLVDGGRGYHGELGGMAAQAGHGGTTVGRSRDHDPRRRRRGVPAG